MENHFREIEDTIYQTRVQHNISLYQLGRQYSIPTLYRVEKHENYTMQILFSYLQRLGLTFTIDSATVKSQEELGQVLRKKRIEAGESLESMHYKSGLQTKGIISIEKGRGCTKKSINKYLDVIGKKVTFKAVNKSLLNKY